MRTRFLTAALVALGAVVVGALGIAVTLATSDSTKWPAWLRPYHRWGWWAVLVLLAIATILAVWQFTHQLRSHTGAGVSTSVPAGGNATQQPSPGPVLNLPPRNLAFTGRLDLLDRLHQQLLSAEGATVAVAVTALTIDGPHAAATAEGTAGRAMVAVPPRVLHGLGGVGKTQLVLEYAHRHAADYHIRWWIPAEQPAAIPASLVALARQLGIPDYAEQTETITALLGELGRRDDWLLIFDNAEDPRDLHPFWPSASGKRSGLVLVTSRNPNWQPLATTLPVDVLPRADSIAFLQRRVGIDKQDADAIAEVLGDLPLALEQAAAYLTETHAPVGEYLELLAARARELFALGRLATSEQTIATVWSVSLRRLHDEAPAAEDLLRLCAFLAPDNIPRSLLEDHPDLLPAPLTTAIQDRLGYQQALGALGRYSLATLTDDTISVHRLVQAVVRHALDPATAQQWAATAVRLIRAAFPADHGDYTDLDTWPTYARLLPHALAVTDHAQAHGVELETTAWLDNEAGWYLRHRADHRQARLLHQRALAIREAKLGPDHPHTAQSLNNLATVLRSQGDSAAARTLFQRALAIREAKLGPDHPHTAQSLNNLGRVLRDQGDLDDARTLHERALAICETRLGPNHPDTAWSLNNLGRILAAQGDLDRARRLHQRALSIRQTRLGPDHPDTAWSLSNLADVLCSQGDLAGAGILYERALRIREARLGPDHPDTALSLNDLARILSAQGNTGRARTLYERALAIREARLGPDHPATVRSRERLAAVAASQENPR